MKLVKKPKSDGRVFARVRFYKVCGEKGAFNEESVGREHEVVLHINNRGKFWFRIHDLSKSIGIETLHSEMFYVDDFTPF